MNNNELTTIFNQQAEHYDQQWARMAPINHALYFLLESVFAHLPKDANILCVGVGTGSELLYLAKQFPNWRFTALEPSGAMLDVCRKRVEEAGISARCEFYEGYLGSLPSDKIHDGATCFLVSQFILDKKARVEFFQQIAKKLKPGAVLASADLSAEAEYYESIIPVWRSVMAPGEASTEGLNRMKAAYAKDVAVLPAAAIALIIQSAGFTTPVPFFQAGLIRAWSARRN